MKRLGFTAPEAWHLNDTDRRKLFSDMAAFGCPMVRVALPWGGVLGKQGVETPRGTYNVGPAATAYRIIDQARAAGMDVLAVITWPLIWYGPFGWTPGSPNDFRQVCAKLAAAFPDVRYWELWNEPNINNFWNSGDPTTYAKYLIAGAAGIREGNPAAKVVSAGLAAATAHRVLWKQWNVDPVTFVRQLYACGAQGSFDVLAYHPYALKDDFKTFDAKASAAQPMIARSDQIREVMIANGDAAVPMWWTEVGASTAQMSPTAQYTNQLRPIIELFQQRDYVQAAFIHNFRNYPYGNACRADDTEANYGIVDQFGAPKPAYDYVRDAMRATR